MLNVVIDLTLSTVNI